MDQTNYDHRTVSNALWFLAQIVGDQIGPQEAEAITSKLLDFVSYCDHKEKPQRTRLTCTDDCLRFDAPIGANYQPVTEDGRAYILDGADADTEYFVRP